MLLNSPIEQSIGQTDPLEASVVIVSKDRRLDLRNAIASALTQVGNIEIIVIDDASTDGTADMVRTEFPTVRYYQASTSKGYIAQRNHGAELARSPFIFSIDDDAVFSSPNIVRQTLKDFRHPSIWAVAIPYIDVNKDPIVKQKSPDPDGTYVTYSFVGTAHALRRETFLKYGGYSEFLLHQGEESNICIKLMDEGYWVVLGNSDPIHHFESPLRDTARQMRQGRRNEVLFAWHRLPFPANLLHLQRANVQALRQMKKHRIVGTFLQGLLAGYSEIAAHPTRRDVVSLSTYQLFMKLRKGPTLRFENAPKLRPKTKGKLHPESANSASTH